MEMNCLTRERAGLLSANLLKTDWTTGWAERTSSRKLCGTKWHPAQLGKAERNANQIPDITHPYQKASVYLILHHAMVLLFPPVFKTALSRCGITPGPCEWSRWNFSPGAPRYNVTGWSIEWLRCLVMTPYIIPVPVSVYQATQW